MKKGVGFNRHPEDCDKYVECYFGYDGKAQAVYRQCPFGMYWDQEEITCKPAAQVPCPKGKDNSKSYYVYISWLQNVLVSCRNVISNMEFFEIADKCSIPSILSYPFGNMENCKAHWVCSHGKSIPMCCPKGQAYVPFKGCVSQPGCNDPCPLRERRECGKRMMWDELDKYEEFVYGYGWVKKSCEHGFIFDSDSCQCLPLNNGNNFKMEDDKKKGRTKK